MLPSGLFPKPQTPTKENYNSMGMYPTSRQLLDNIERRYDLTPANGSDFWTAYWAEVSELPNEVAVNRAAAIQSWADDADYPAVQESSLFRESRRYETSYDALPPDTIAAEPNLRMDSDLIAEEALSKLGTYQQRRCYLLYTLNLRQAQIAARLGISQQRVSILLQQCRELIAAWFDRTRDWQTAYLADLHGKALRLDTDKESAKVEQTISRLRALGKDIAPAGRDRDGDPIYLMDGRYTLRGDQLNTLLALGAVNTSTYGMVHLSTLANLRQYAKEMQRVAA